VPASTLGNDFFKHEEHLHALVGSRTGETYRMGDIVDVRLVEAAPFAGALRFEILSEGRTRMRGGAAAKSRKSAGRDKKPSSRNKPARPSSGGGAGSSGNRGRRR
jgi:ribonuclease R